MSEKSLSSDSLSSLGEVEVNGAENSKSMGANFGVIFQNCGKAKDRASNRMSSVRKKCASIYGRTPFFLSLYRVKARENGQMEHPKVDTNNYIFNSDTFTKCFAKTKTANGIKKFEFDWRIFSFSVLVVFTNYYHANYMMYMSSCELTILGRKAIFLAI